MTIWHEEAWSADQEIIIMRQYMDTANVIELENKTKQFIQTLCAR